ncbi:myosin light chain kinase, smooth muscle-like [Tribolium madens]|uniref:myosin light chain kinase, smooth muscle-like n=1 Tax=Tribolium madens TaxID=41895 RepID=UPI001CF74955|nr:myosin light chain kinase, smooth muscle-like [Tribolium madens]XP_044259472.1 myosin light chain kinase, smooth muscle-like [Tribolium madens]
MIRVDENDPVGEVQLSFPYRNVQIQRGVDPKELYELESEIGRGKFGTVYKCREKATGLSLAAKFIAVPKKEDRRNVEREVDIMKTLQHPRLIQLYDAFENGKVMCVILELIEGGELFERVIDDDFVLTEKSCTVFMRQICEGVDFIHKQRILHLDMKPENILCLTRTGNRIKIIDFGLARRFDPDKKLQVLFGTPEFVAPEVVNFDQIGFGTDMWSVGVICYVLLSGLSPFMGATDVETMANVTIAKYDFDDEAFQEISDTAKDFIQKLLKKDLNQRMSAEECLNHEWLKRKKTVVPRSSSMDVTKDNLRQFVERWNEHPNSPYVFEVTSQLIAPTCTGGLHLSDSLHSLVGMSPSPCGSLASSPGSDNAFLNNNDLLMPPSVDHFRRSSDSTCILKGPDVAERINLAEEIRKLSDKLFQLSNMSTSVTNDSFDELSLPTIIPKKVNKEPTIINHSPVERSIPIKIESKVHNGLPRDHPESPNCGVPWRRTKYRLNYMSRDVPLIAKNSQTSFQNQFEKSFNETSSIDSTKNLLLRLLEQWDGPHGPARPNARHGSISTEWSENDTLGQRSISSLNNFFQSRATSKKITTFHSHNQ